MPLRSAPLPRMAGHLSFMRAQTKAICDVSLAIWRCWASRLKTPARPMLASLWRRAHCAKPRSILAGMQTRNSATRLILMHDKTFRPTALHERLCDLGDISPGSEEAIHAALRAATSQISRNGACAVILGGSDRLSETVQSALLIVRQRSLAVRHVMRAIFM